MAYGLKCWDASGNLVLDTSGRYCRLVYTNKVTSDGNVTLSYLDGKQSVQWAEAYQLDPTAPLAGYIAPKVTRSGNTISWSGGDADESLILVFAYT